MNENVRYLIKIITVFFVQDKQETHEELLENIKTVMWNTLFKV